MDQSFPKKFRLRFYFARSPGDPQPDPQSPLLHRGAVMSLPLADPSLPAKPSAPCLRMNAVCASENPDAFIALRFSQPGNRRGKL
jgi:hypothetical protein